MPARTEARPGRSWIPAAALALLVAAPALVRLLAVPDQFPLRSWLIDEPAALPARAIELPVVEQTGREDVLRLVLATSDAPALQRFDRLEPILATYGTAPRLTRAELAFAGTDCRFVAPAGAALANNDRLGLVRQGDCTAIGAVHITLDLWIERGSGRVAVWTFEGETAGGLLLHEDAGGRRWVVRGMAATTAPASSLSRADLLASLWRVSTRTVLGRGAGAAGLLLFGLVLLGLADRASGRPRGVLAGAAGAGCLMGGLALGHALLIPPLQAPDEPVHILSFAELIGQTDWPSETERLARRVHFERIRHRGDQHYRASDIGHDWPQAWSAAVAPVAVAARSPLAAWWWQGLGGWLRALPIEQALWRVRAANSLLAGLAAGVAAMLLILLLPGRSSLVALGLFVAPTVPFYGMFWADAPVILAASLVLAAALAPIVLDAPHRWLAGAPVGVATTLVIVSGRRSWPLAVAVLVILAGRAVAGSAVHEDGRKRLVFWGGLLSVLIPGSLWALTLEGVAGGGTLLKTLAPGTEEIVRAVLSRPWLMVMALASLPAIDVVATRRGWLQSPRSSLWLWTARASAAALVAVTVASHWVALPTTNGLFVSDLDVGPYVSRVMLSMAAPFRTGHFDLLLSTLFWSGFGWVDVVVPEWMLALFGLTTSLMVAWWWWSAAEDPARRHAFFAALLVVSLGVALVGAAVGAYALRYELYGRFLLGWYLLLLVPAWARAARTAWPWWAWYAAPVAAHAFALQLILLRYF